MNLNLCAYMVGFCKPGHICSYIYAYCSSVVAVISKTKFNVIKCWNYVADVVIYHQASCFITEMHSHDNGSLLENRRAQ